MRLSEYSNGIFDQPYWLDSVAPGKWSEIVITDNSQNTLARMPYMLSGKSVLMPKLTQNIGIWFAEEIQADYGKQKQVINQIFSELKKFTKIEIALNPVNTYVLPFRWLGFTIVPCFTYRIEDLSDLTKVYGDFHKTIKDNIKLAQKKVKLTYETNIDHLLDLIGKTYEAQHRKIPFDEQMLINIVDACEESGHGHFVEAVDESGNIHSCAYFVYDENATYLLVSGTDRAFGKSKAKTLLVWDGIQFAAEHSKVFDFEGSMIEGIENFDRQFGGKCVPYYTIRKGSIIDDIKEVLKPRIKRLIGYKI